MDQTIICAWYRSLDLDLEQIGELMDRSPATVSRLLKKAGSMEILRRHWELDVDPETLSGVLDQLRNQEAERQILNRWPSLETCVVIDPRRPGDREPIQVIQDAMLRAVGRAAAFQFNALVPRLQAKPGPVAAIAWGYSTAALIDGLYTIRPDPVLKVQVVPTIGYLQPRDPRADRQKPQQAEGDGADERTDTGPRRRGGRGRGTGGDAGPSRDISAQTLCRRMAQLLESTNPPLFLAVPGMMPPWVPADELPAIRQAFAGDPGYRRLFAPGPGDGPALCENLDFIAMGIGGLSSHHQWDFNADLKRFCRQVLEGWKPEGEHGGIIHHVLAAENPEHEVDELLRMRLVDEGIRGDIASQYVQQRGNTLYAPNEEQERAAGDTGREGFAGKLNARSTALKLEHVYAVAERARRGEGAGVMVIATGPTGDGPDREKRDKMGIIKATVAADNNPINHLVIDWYLADRLLGASATARG